MKKFLDEDFLLDNRTAQKLYYDYASTLPIIDYHCHLPPDQIAKDMNFKNLTQVWQYGDHYKWRAMRANGIAEEYITGDKSDYEKFEKWAETIPYTFKNPLYHWSCLELRRYFDIHELLSPSTAKRIYDECSEKLQSPEYSTRNLIRKMNVEILVTTDDPLDDLGNHKKIKKDGFDVVVLPAFRPDLAMNTENVEVLADYIRKMEKVTGKAITHFEDYLAALKSRHDYFSVNGCKLSDHGIEKMYVSAFAAKEIEVIFQKILADQMLSAAESLQFKSCMLHYFAQWDHEKDWVQQYHLGSLRNNNTQALQKLGPNSGFDAIGDFSQAGALVQFFDKLQCSNQLAKTIVYNLNPGDNEVFATIIGSFNDGSVPGKMQLGSAWWFLDNKEGIERQITALGNMGMLSRFVGMLTDSRSFLSYPRHEYFRRVLCNLLGKDVENGELPADMQWLGKMVEGICYTNAKVYFNLCADSSVNSPEKFH